MLTHLFSFKMTGMNFKIFGFFITVPIFIFKDLYMSVLSTILYIQKQTNKKKAVLSRLNFKTIFFYIHLQFSRTQFTNKLIVSDLLMLWIIQQ